MIEERPLPEQEERGGDRPQPERPRPAPGKDSGDKAEDHQPSRRCPEVEEVAENVPVRDGTRD
jgi:hypothetical protein